jgi:hypothetical protein
VEGATSAAAGTQVSRSDAFFACPVPGPARAPLRERLARFIPGTNTCRCPNVELMTRASPPVWGVPDAMASSPTRWSRVTHDPVSGRAHER